MDLTKTRRCEQVLCLAAVHGGYRCTVVVPHANGLTLPLREACQSRRAMSRVKH